MSDGAMADKGVQQELAGAGREDESELSIPRFVWFAYFVVILNRPGQIA
jgi:hypothetical protein